MANINKVSAMTEKNNQQPVANIEQLAEEQIKEQITRIPIDDIEPNPKQPRTDFNEQKLKELAESIKQYDVVQPVTVSKLPSGTYRLISGERRWRAAKLAQLKDIPAYIKPTADIQLLELAILENLQREDLSPMEQARAFRQFAEECKLNAKEIAMRQGKSEYFVRQQIKLTDLIPQWQKILSKDGIPISIALQIAVLPVALQTDLYQNNVNKEDEKAERPIIQINQYTLNQYKGLLSEACFDITNPELDKKAGACTTCPFNTACNSLFPEEVKNPRCNNIACFKNKTVIHQNKEFNKAKDDPTVLLVYEAHSIPDYLKKLKGEGNEILKLGSSDDCKEIKEPQKPIWNEFQNWGKRQNHPDKQIKSNFKKAEEDYEFAKKTFDKNVATAKYKKAFVAYDQYERQTGKYIFVEINSKTTPAKIAQKAIADGNATIQDIDNEIERLNTKKARNLELAAENAHENIVQAIKDHKPFFQLPKALVKTDQMLILFLLLENTSFNNRPDIQKVIKSKELFNFSDPVKFFTALESLTKSEISFLIRQIILDKYAANLPSTAGGLMVRKMAETLPDIPISKFEKEQNEIYGKRNLRLDERIVELKSEKTKTTTAKKPETAKTKINTKQRTAA